jgi:hypothetical protein
MMIPLLISRERKALLIIFIGERKNHASSVRFLLYPHEEESSIEGPTRQANDQENRRGENAEVGNNEVEDRE